MRMYGQADKRDEANSRFSQFSIAREKWTVLLWACISDNPVWSLYFDRHCCVSLNIRKCLLPTPSKKESPRKQTCSWKWGLIKPLSDECSSNVRTAVRDLNLLRSFKNSYNATVLWFRHCYMNRIKTKSWVYCLIFRPLTPRLDVRKLAGTTRSLRVNVKYYIFLLNGRHLWILCALNYSFILNG